MILFKTFPQIPDMGSLYDEWHRTHLGSTDDFYAFITTPSPERARFLNSLPSEPRWEGSLLVKVIQQ